MKGRPYTAWAWRHRDDALVRVSTADQDVDLGYIEPAMVGPGLVAVASLPGGPRFMIFSLGAWQAARWWVDCHLMAAGEHLQDVEREALELWARRELDAWDALIGQSQRSKT